MKEVEVKKCVCSWLAWDNGELEECVPRQSWLECDFHFLHSSKLIPSSHPAPGPHTHPPHCCQGCLPNTPTHKKQTVMVLFGSVYYTKRSILWFILNPMINIRISHSHTHLFLPTHSHTLTCSLTQRITPVLPHSQTDWITPSSICSLLHPYSFTYMFTPSLTGSQPYSVTLSHTGTLIYAHSPTYSLFHIQMLNKCFWVRPAGFRWWKLHTACWKMVACLPVHSESQTSPAGNTTDTLLKRKIRTHMDSHLSRCRDVPETRS